MPNCIYFAMYFSKISMICFSHRHESLIAMHAHVPATGGHLSKEVYKKMLSITFHINFQFLGNYKISKLVNCCAQTITLNNKNRIFKKENQTKNQFRISKYWAATCYSMINLTN